VHVRIPFSRCVNICVRFTRLGLNAQTHVCIGAYVRLDVNVHPREHALAEHMSVLKHPPSFPSISVSRYLYFPPARMHAQAQLVLLDCLPP
jgi:hypothetical protein